MSLKIWFKDFEKDKNIKKILKQVPVFIKDDHPDVYPGNELDVDNLYYMKLGDYYLSDIEYRVGIDGLESYEVVTDIQLTSNDEYAMHIEKWEIDCIKSAFEQGIEIVNK